MGAAADPALHRLPVAALVGGRRQHRVLGGQPAEAGTLAPARHPGGHRRRAQHLGAAELDQHRPGRVLLEPAGEAHRPKFVVGPAVSSVHAQKASATARQPPTGPRRLAQTGHAQPGDRADLRAEEPLPEPGERLRIAGGQELVRRRRGGAGGEQVELGEPAVDVLGGLVGAGHQGHLIAHHQRQRAGQQRVVGAAEHQGVQARCAAAAPGRPGPARSPAGRR